MSATHIRFQPPQLLKSPHTQTLMSSLGRKSRAQARARTVTDSSTEVLLTAGNGARLQAWTNRQDFPAPTIIIIHGWLGSAESSYVLSASAEFWAAGFNVVRLNLRDHGDTAHLNEGLFHSARTQEVVDAVLGIKALDGFSQCGLIGFSLGGNFALRVARETQIPSLAICPVVDPTGTMYAIDGGWSGYKLYFIRKWHRALWQKQKAFPERYDFGPAFRLRSVETLTDYFVDNHTDYRNTPHYLSAYTLTGDELEGTEATIVMANDDPVIPAAGFSALPGGIEIIRHDNGGHCGFISNPGSASWVDRYALLFFADRLG